MTIICEHDPTLAENLRLAVGSATVLENVEALRRHLDNTPNEHTAVLGPSIDLRAALDLANGLRINRPALGVVLVRHRIDTSVLAEALRAGIREVLDGHDPANLAAAVNRSESLATALRERDGTPRPEGPNGPRGRIVTVFSAKGGCGKTTLATNLAAALADRGRREVCLVDLDLAFGDVAIVLQLVPSHTIADAVPAGSQIDFAAVQPLLTPHTPGLTALAAPIEPGTAETIPAELVGRILVVLREHFDFVVIDTPPAFDDQVLAAFDVSDFVALIATLDIPALKNLKLTMETLDLLNFPRERCRLVLNRADSKVGLAIGEVEKTLRTPIALQIPSSRDVPATINRGVPIVQDDPRHPVSLAIRSFAERHVAAIAPLALSTDQSKPLELRSDRRAFLRRRPRVG